MRGRRVTFCRGSVAIVTAKLLLHHDGANRRVYLNLSMEAIVISLAQVLNKVTRPGTAEAAGGIETVFNLQRFARDDWNQGAGSFQIFELVIILNSRQID